MDNEFKNGLDVLLTKMESFVSSKTVIGDPVDINGVIIVPIVDVVVGVGAGAGGKDSNDSQNKDSNTNIGGGLGAKITPSAVLVINNDGVQLVNVKNQDSVNKLIDMVPDVLSKFNIGGKKKNDVSKETEVY